MSEVTLLLQRMRQGDPAAGEAFTNQVYDELRRIAAAKIARENAGQSLQATSLVHEAWLKLGDGVFANRAHFFGAAAEAMRRILVDRARQRQAAKRGGRAVHLQIDDLEIAAPCGDEAELLDIHEALDALAAAHPQKAELVKLRYFIGLSYEEVAGLLGISVTTAKRDWTFARGWLYRRIVARS